jgi:DeoR/GlpR family transcriptional regulator of sugar metabolism/DNA-binding LacI/PurR family transcriptional regulator
LIDTIIEATRCRENAGDMIKEKRAERIVALLAEAGEELSIIEIANRLGHVSQVTVRRDIAELAVSGALERTRGGAILPNGRPIAGADSASAQASDILEGVDAIVLPPIGGRGGETLRMAARRRRIPFLAESSPQEGGVYLGPDNFMAGRELGRLAGRLAKERFLAAHVLLVSHDELPNTRARCDGFLKGFGETFSKIDRQWRVDGRGGYKQSLRVSLDAFAAERAINVIFGVNDHSTLAALEAAERRGVADIAAFSVGGEGSALFEALATSGRLLACAALFPEVVGARAVEALAAVFNGAAMPSELHTPYVVVTPATLERYYRRTESGWALTTEAMENALAPHTPLSKLERSPGERRTIGFVPHYPAHDWYRNMGRAISERATALGLEVKIAAPQAGIAREILTLRRMIAATAASVIESGSTILINAGAASLLLADELAARRDLTVITNSIEVLERLTGRPGLKVILTSGEYQAKDRCLVGPSLGALFETLRVDQAFLSVDGLSANFGPSVTDERLALAARRFIAAARETVVLADHSLVGMEASHRIAPLRDVHLIVTDSGSLPADRLAFASAGLRVAVADEEPEKTPQRLDGEKDDNDAAFAANF